MEDLGTIWIGNDHGGYDLKMRVLEHLVAQEIAVHNVGCDSKERVRYPIFAARVASAVSRGEARRGILICTTGVGMSIMANKYRGVRASLCTSTLMARLTRAHNDSNILCLAGGLTGPVEALEMVDIWLRTPYDGGRHTRSLDLIAAAEAALCNPGGWESDEPA